MENITAIKHTADQGRVWVRKDNPEWYLGETIYLSPKDSIDNYEQTLEVIVEEEVLH